MQDHDKTQFVELMNVCAANYSVELDKPRLKILWASLEEFSFGEVKQSVMQCIRQCKFFPSVAEIIERIPSTNAHQHIGADEAWAIALAAMDEYETVVWTKEIAEAKSVAQDLYDMGDTVAARMAFKSAYDRITRAAGKSDWFVTEGFDAQRRADAVKQAVEKGLLPSDTLNRYQLEGPGVSFVQLTSMAAKRSGDSSAVEKLRAIKSMIMTDEDEADSIARRERSRIEFEEKRADELQRVDSMMASKSMARTH